MSDLPAAGPPARAPLSGQAVAALVCALAWLGGLGSLAAVVLGVLAVSRISASSGRLRGRGLATAGLTLGILGLLGTALAVVLLSVHNATTQLNSATDPVSLTLGQSAELPADGGPSLGAPGGGAASVTVESFADPTPATASGLLGVVSPDPGKVFAVADVEACAGPDGVASGPGVQVLQFQLAFADGTTGGVSLVDAQDPPLSHVASVPPGGCVRGTLTFEVAPGARPVGVRYTQFLGHPFTWAVPGG